MIFVHSIRTIREAALAEIAFRGGGEVVVVVLGWGAEGQLQIGTRRLFSEGRTIKKK